jgi:hypothetical protein
MPSQMVISVSQAIGNVFAQITPALVVSGLAFVFSMATFYFGYRNRMRDVAFEVIPKSYERFYDAHKIELQHPHLTHLFVTFDQYPKIKNLVIHCTKDIGDEKRTAYLLQERAVVDLLMTYYEQITFQWESTRDKERKFVKSIIDHFEKRVLTNPRVIWWWQADCGGLETGYDDETRKRWHEKILAPIAGGNVSEWRDDSGPFGQTLSLPSVDDGHLGSTHSTAAHQPPRNTREF